MTRTLWPTLLVSAALAFVTPLCGAQPGAASKGSLSGKVLEVQQAGAYTYLRLKTAEGETWAAVPAANVSAGAQVRIADPTTIEKLESRSLKRTFDTIVFGTIESADAVGVPAGAASGMPPPSHGAGGAPAPMPAPVKVTKASGPEGRTVAEVVNGKASLKDKTVVVRGQVVKMNAGIMGKNWVHLRDGTGSAADGSNDLLVTTQDKPSVGDVVAARGTVRTDVTLGPGYSYLVMIENAALKK